jgi:hypothetical protein
MAGGEGAAGEDDFGTAGWLLVAAVFVAFVVVPVLIAVRPPGLPFRVAYLVLPLVPAVLLALLAVWVTARP